MKLSRIPTKESTIKIGLTVKESTNRLIDQYRTFVTEAAGVDISRQDLLEQAIIDFFNSDRDFLRWQAAAAAGAPAKQPASLVIQADPVRIGQLPSAPSSPPPSSGI